MSATDSFFTRFMSLHTQSFRTKQAHKKDHKASITPSAALLRRKPRIPKALANGWQLYNANIFHYDTHTTGIHNVCA